MTTYSYDRENRLISQNVDGNVTSFAYDGFGRKKRESRGVNPDVILNWDGDQMIVESSDLDPEAPSKAYYIADDVIYAENSNLGSKRSRRDYAVDFLGSVTGLVDGDCSLSSARRWSAFGKLLSGSAEPIGYFWTGNTGSRVYQSLGLNDNRARHYGRNIKQWITRDPLWPSELPYAYVDGDPVTRIDPSGRSARYPWDKKPDPKPDPKPLFPPIPPFVGPVIYPGCTCVKGKGTVTNLFIIPKSRHKCYQLACNTKCYSELNPSVQQQPAVCTGLKNCGATISRLPACDKSKSSWETCGRIYTGFKVEGCSADGFGVTFNEVPGYYCGKPVHAEQSNWPNPSTGFNALRGYCCVECKMRYCCDWINGLTDGMYSDWRDCDKKFKGK